jgi:hypothetical protein
LGIGYFEVEKTVVAFVVPVMDAIPFVATVMRPLTSSRRAISSPILEEILIFKFQK